MTLIPQSKSNGVRRQTPYHFAFRILQILLPLVLIIILLRSSSLERIWDLWRNAHKIFLALSALAVLTTHLLGAASLFALIHRISISNYFRFILLYFHIQSIAFFTPAQVAEVSIPLLARRIGIHIGDMTAALLMQRLLGISFPFLVAIISATEYISIRTLAACATVCILALGIFLALLHSNVLHKYLPHLRTFIDHVKIAFTRMFYDRRIGFLFHMCFVAARFASAVAATWLTLLAFDIYLPFFDLTALVSVATIAAIIPLTPSGLGVVEGIFVAALQPKGFSVELVLSACLAGRLVTIFVLAIFSIIYALMPYHGDNHATPISN